MAEQKIQVALGAASYEIMVQPGLLNQVGPLSRLVLPQAQRALVVTNTTVGPLYADTVQNSLTAAGFTTQVHSVPDGEEYKNLNTLSRLYDAAVAAELDRSAVICALGGGVVGDMAGLLAATFMRGIAFIQIPTTLLAQVDSSVGGKVAVNHPAGKNLVGAFYQPHLVIIDPQTLATLPPRQWAAGLAEVVKYGVMADAAFFTRLKDTAPQVLAHAPTIITELILTSCRIKAQVVSQDEREQGIRAILNLGHTVGHALEASTNYEFYLHGEAVALGLLAAAKIAEQICGFPPAQTQALAHLLHQFGLPTRIQVPPGQTPSAYLEQLCALMTYDKKAVAGRWRFVLPEKIGKVVITANVPPALVHQVLLALLERG